MLIRVPAAVLRDMSMAMFDPSFVETLLRPQPMYSPANLRKVFDHLSKASIMRLNDESMGKVRPHGRPPPLRNASHAPPPAPLLPLPGPPLAPGGSAVMLL
jgi:hypothetical protein